jgi:hypothetical protein
MLIRFPAAVQDHWRPDEAEEQSYTLFRLGQRAGRGAAEDMVGEYDE